MADPHATETTSALRLLPSTDELLSTPQAMSLLPRAGRRELTALARAAIDELRRELMSPTASDNGTSTTLSKENLLDRAIVRLEAAWRRSGTSRIRKVINATGVIVHTNLGRAPLSADATEALKLAAGYANVEYDLQTGDRGHRGAGVEELLLKLTGAEAALVVNNCAAAALIVLTVLAKGAETVVSRGELVEIGGDFRIPDVLAQSGSRLIEVGSTNRTKLADYDRAIGDQTALVMRVHPSNYRIVGFTEKPSLKDLSDLCHRKNVLLYEDAGSGALLDLTPFGLTEEPVIPRSIEQGADIITFSGDKLLGGSQAGLIVGRRDLVERIRKHPLYRALRADKLSYAVLEATLGSYLREDAIETVPVMRMLATSREELDARAEDLSKRLRERLTGLLIEVVEGESVVGGGAAPGVKLMSPVIAISDTHRSATEIAERLRIASVPIVTRIENDRLLIDLRTVALDEEEMLFETAVAALG